MRPLYENSKTLLDEVKFFCDLKNSIPEFNSRRFRKLPIRYEIECVVEDVTKGDIVAFAEFKQRYNERDKYPTLFISHAKYKKLLEYDDFRRSILFVRWRDVDGMHVVGDHLNDILNYKIAWGGRNDRGDWQDNEPVIHIPVDHFEVLQTSKIQFTPPEITFWNEKWSSGEGWVV
jgi:hypothetical protein